MPPAEKPTAVPGRLGLPVSLALGLGAGLLAALLSLLAPSLELATLDARFHLRGPRPASGQVALVLLDDTSLATVSTWGAHARLLWTLRALGVELVVSDVLFRHAGQDAAALVDAQRALPVVHPLGVDFFPPGDWPLQGAIDEQDAPLPPALLARFDPVVLPRGEALAVDRALAPYPPLAAAAAGLGHIGARLDPDGVLRRLPLVADLDGRVLPCTPLAALRLRLGAGGALAWTGHEVVVPLPDGRGELRVPTDPRGQALIDFLGPFDGQPLPIVRAERVLGVSQEPELGAELQRQLAGRVVYLGMAGSGSTDLSPTPFDVSPPAPRVLALASLLDQLLAGRSLREAPAWLGWLLALGSGLGLAWLARGRRAWPLHACAAGALAAWALAAQGAFAWGGWVLPVAAPGLAVVLAWVGGLGARLWRAERARRQVVQTFGRYLSQAVLDKVLAQPDSLGAHAERKVVSVLFSDIVRFSDTCERLEPEQVHDLLGEYLERMVACVFAEEGTVDKFIGDGLLAFFGDPVPQADHAARAVRVARAMLIAVEELNRAWSARGRPTLQIRIGVNTGPVVVGNVGAPRRMEYTVLGHEVNRAQRLEAAARPGTLLMGQATQQAVAAEFPEARPVGEVHGKREERIPAWELAGPGAAPRAG
ncbi:MAG TPA: adenylate/guanylate cyclase domain-containing protein [Myxococcota bacterium]|nr:adenylate/guanylate cyclase domain-containing protein [Myxococcota bacterium]HRY94979.1 adenylate/guanylate cyclase domain-containing protein [Myxococcota bacterium]HSA20970.1 adenylate/guanylate cyclase domain-containing protein [Myxococcota bacterium]